MALSTTVKEIFSTEFNTVLENESASRCLEGFQKGVPPVLAVTDAQGRYLGIVNQRSFLRSRLDLNRTKVKSLITIPPVSNPSDSISKIAKLMVSSSSRQLPVFEKDRLLGFVTDEAVIHIAVKGEWGNTLVESIMTRAPHTMEANRSIGAVLGLMREFGVSHVPIVESGRLVGIVSIKDILESVYLPPKRMGNKDVAGEQIKALGIAAKGIMRSPVITINPQTRLHECDQMMHNQDISCLCVVDSNRLVGVITKLDFLEPISQMETPERKLTIQFSFKDVEINPEQQQFIISEFDSFTHRFQEAFQSGSLFVYIKSNRCANMRGGNPMVHCRLQFRTTRGNFYAASEGWGIEPTFKVALDHLERRLLRSKELLAYNSKYAQEFLYEMDLP